METLCKAKNLLIWSYELLCSYVVKLSYSCIRGMINRCSIIFPLHYNISDCYINTPTMTAVNKEANVPPISALKPNLASVAFF